MFDTPTNYVFSCVLVQKRVMFSHSHTKRDLYIFFNFRDLILHL